MRENRKNDPDKYKQELENKNNNRKNNPIKYQNELDKNKDYKRERYQNDPV